MSIRNLSRPLFALVATLLLTAGFAHAQSNSATVSGLITDASGAALPGATVTLTNVDTGFVVKVKSNDSGLYRVTSLTPGRYKETVEREGFKTSVRENLQLHIEDEITINAPLAIGAVSDVIDVDASNSVLETTSPTVSQVIEGRQVTETPLNGRNTMNLVALTPGVVPQGATSGAASNNTGKGAFTNAFGFGNYSIAGGISNQNSTYLDGAPLNGIEGHALAFVIQQDAVQEFRVESSVVNPQYGEFSGGVISFATKSGTNHIHGTAYEYLRNTIFNANDFFLNNGAQPRQQFHQNQFGLTAGGPIKKDKIFFYAAYEGFRQAQGVPNSGRVPTVAEAMGDFRADPAIENPKPFGNAAGTLAYSGTGVAYKRQVQCNGVLNVFCSPTTAAPLAGDAVVDPTAYYMAQTLHYFPAPNVPNPSATVNFIQSGHAAAVNGTYDARVDANLGAKNRLFGRYARLDRAQDGTHFLNNPGGPNSQTAVGATTVDYLAGDTITLTPTSVLELRASYLRYFSYLLPVNTTNLAALGPFWAGVSGVFPPYFPDISITNLPAQPYTGLNQFAQQPLGHTIISGTYSKILGRHSLAAGGEFRYREEYFQNIPFTTGLFVFAGTNTACIPSATNVCGVSGAPGPPNVIIPGTGATPQADFISGYFTAAPVGFSTANYPSIINRYGGLFVNDTFQLSPRTTLTAGLRYELPGGFLEKNDKNTVLLPALANPLVLVNSAAYSSRSDLQNHLTLLSPRVGFSYSPYSGTSVRAGYSLVYLPVEIVFGANPTGSPINVPNTFIRPAQTISAPLGYLPGTNTPNTNILTPIGRGYANSPTYFYGQNISSRVPTSRFPRLQQWNMNVQQQFTSSLVMQLAYLGARGQYLPIANTIDINQLPDQYDSMGAALAAPVVAGSPVTVGQSLRPYPVYQLVNQESAYIGDTSYHSLQATLSKKLRGGGTFLANYSWSKFLGNADSLNSQVESHVQGNIQDYNNLHAEKSYESFDIPHRLVVSYIVDLPFGKGKRYMAGSGALVNNLVGGWNAGGINSFQSGFPLAVSQSTGNLLTTLFGAGTLRPNIVPGCNRQLGVDRAKAAQTGAATLNFACYTALATTSTTFGNAPRTDGSIRSEGIDNWDFSVGKVTPIRENVNMVFRAEAFNVINRVQFGDPNVNLSAGAASFGALTQQVNAPRSFQFSLRLNY